MGQNLFHGSEIYRISGFINRLFRYGFIEDDITEIKEYGPLIICPVVVVQTDTQWSYWTMPDH